AVLAGPALRRLGGAAVGAVGSVRPVEAGGERRGAGIERPRRVAGGGADAEALVVRPHHAAARLAVVLVAADVARPAADRAVEVDLLAVLAAEAVEAADVAVGIDDSAAVLDAGAVERARAVPGPGHLRDPVLHAVDPGHERAVHAGVRPVRGD